MNDTTSTPPRRAGRPRSFDLSQALSQAVALFCTRGYHACSITELAGAMRVTPGSLYKAFPDKRALFLAALDQYRAQRLARLEQELAGARTGRDRIARVLAVYAAASLGEAGRQGCLVIATTMEIASFDPEIAQRIGAIHQANGALLTRLIQQGQADGSICPEIAPEPTASALLCLLQGMRVLGKTEPEPNRIQAICDTALRLLGPAPTLQ